MNRPTVHELLDDHRLYHSEWQMDYFITGQSGGTAYGMYQHALRELFKRYRGLKELYASRELLLIDIAELSNGGMCGWLRNTFARQRKAINLAQKKLGFEDLERNIKDTTREFLHFYGQAATLKEQLGELTPERKVELEADTWRHRVKMMAAKDLLSQGRISANVFDMVIATPREWRDSVMQEITQDDGKPLLDWFKSYEAPKCGPVASLSPPDVKALLSL